MLPDFIDDVSYIQVTRQSVEYTTEVARMCFYRGIAYVLLADCEQEAFALAVQRLLADQGINVSVVSAVRQWVTMAKQDNICHFGLVLQGQHGR